MEVTEENVEEATAARRSFQVRMSMERLKQMKENVEMSNAIKAFQARITMAKVNVRRGSAQYEEVKGGTSNKYFFGEYDISGLPLPVKKHIIIAGIIQGDIFQYGDGFANIKEVNSLHGNAVSGKTLHLQVRALTPKSFEMALEVVEALIQESLDPNKKIFKKPLAKRAWSSVLNNEFAIQDLTKPVIRHLITKGIIKGEIFTFAGAVVNAKGSPYLVDESPPEFSSERPIYLLITGPNEMALYWAFERINKLIKEAEEMMKNSTPPMVPEETVHSSVNDEHPALPTDPKTVKTSEVIETRDEPEVKKAQSVPPFMPHLGQNCSADVRRCVVLVQWLLAHPLLVSFMICPPKGLESKQVSRKLTITALLCLPLYDQYKCSHNMSKKICQECHKFFNEAQVAVHQCFDAVISSGYDISDLITVDDYIKNVSVDPKQVGVVYDYPLPTNHFYKNRCRLFLDLIVNHGFDINECHIESYLKSTPHRYPVGALHQIVADAKKYATPKEAIKFQYPLFCPLNHHGGLINFDLTTIGKASPGQRFPADAEKIPKCKYFPFLDKLSVFLKLSKFNTKNPNVEEKESVSDSISKTAYELTKESSKMTDSNIFPRPYGTLFASANQQHTQPNITSMSSLAMPGSSMTSPSMLGSSVPPHTVMESTMPLYMMPGSMMPASTDTGSSVFQPSNMGSLMLPSTFSGSFSSTPQTCSTNPLLRDNQIQLGTLQNYQNELINSTAETQKPPGNLPPSFLTMQSGEERKKLKQKEPEEEKAPHPGRIQRKLKRQEKAEQIKEKKREEIKTTIETLKERIGSNSFWTIDRNSLLKAENAQEKLANLLATPKPAYNLPVGNTESPPPNLLTGSMHPQNLQLSLINMQMSMPTTQKSVFRFELPPSVMNESKPMQMSMPTMQKSVFRFELPPSVMNESKPILRPALLNAESDQVNQLKQEMKLESKDVPEENVFSEVISKLEEYIQVTSTMTADSANPPIDSVSEGADSRIQQGVSTALDQNAASSAEHVADPPEDCAFSAIIQQLKQYIDSNDQTSSQDDSEQLESEDHVKQPIETTASSNITPDVFILQEQGPNKLKRPSEEPISECSQPKRISTAHTSSSTSRKTQPPSQELIGRKEIAAPQPSTAVQKSPMTPFGSLVSILGDSLLKGARSLWGGSYGRDIREDTYTLGRLTEEVMRFHLKGGRLNHYCVVMCGVNDILMSTHQKDFVSDLKKLIFYLSSKNYSTVLVTLPPIVSSSMQINKIVPSLNGFFLSYHTKPKVTIIQFHKKFLGSENRKSFLNSIHVEGSNKSTNVVLSDMACELIKELIMQDVLGHHITDQ